MITLASYRPEFFNQNGDQGNIEVLGMQLMWRGIDCEVSSKDFDEADFFMVGDASRAVMREFSADLELLVPMLSERFAAGMPTLLVGSAHEYFAGKVEGLPALKAATRKSEFREVTQSGLSAFGYRNSEFGEDLVVAGAFVSTTLFGPVLAKSPDLLDLVLRRLGVSEQLPSGIGAELTQYVQEIRQRAIAG
jgi:CobQ-like glutamine amidotransferase family enzyme